MNPDTPIKTRLGAILRTMRWQLGLVPLGWWLWPTLVIGGVVWAVLISNQISTVSGQSPAIHFVLVRLLAELQAIPGLIGVLVVLVDEIGRSRHTTVLALPWPNTVFLVRLAGAGILAWIWALAVVLLGTVILLLVIPDPTQTEKLTELQTYILTPIYSALIGIVAGSLAQLIHKVVPSLIIAVAGIGLIIPLLGIFFAPARFLPGVIGLPPTVTISPDTIPPQHIGLPLLALWALGLTALALWRTTQRDW